MNQLKENQMIHLRISSLHKFKLPYSQCTIARFPKDIDIEKLARPIKAEIDEFVDTANNSSELSNYRQFSKSLRKTRASWPSWKFIDSNNKQLLGNKLAMDFSVYFLAIQRGNEIEIIPVNVWYGFIQCAFEPTDHEEALASDILEKKRRLALQTEEKNNEKIYQKFLSVTPGGQLPDVSRDLKYTEKYVYAEDAGLLIQQKKKFKQMLKYRKNEYLREDQGTENSALNVREIKKAEVDWDFDDQGLASDDEEYTENDIDNFIDDVQKDEYLETEKEEVFTKLGQKVSSALETQKEQEEVDELAQFSDDEDDEDNETVLSGATTETDKKSSVSSQKFKQQKKVTDENTPESIKQKVIRILSLQGGRMPTKDFVEHFNITDKTSEIFKTVKKILNEICEVYTETRHGVSVRLIELQSQFRQ